jgi:hypothetical protein
MNLYLGREEKMNRDKYLGVFLVTFWIVLSMSASLSADVMPGDVIDKTNWQKAEGLLPEPVLNWVKKGDFILQIGELAINPREMHPEYVLKAFETNRGRYDIDNEGGIVDSKTGKHADFILGLPFSDLDPKDPKVAQKLMYNHQYMQHIYGNFKFNFQLIWVGRSGFERDVEAQWQSGPLTAYPGAKDLANPDGIEKYAIMVVKKPYDLAGTAIMLWRFIDRKSVV